MKHFVFLFILVFGTADACQYKRIDVDSRYEKAEYIFTAVTISNDINKANKVGMPIEISVRHEEIIKGSNPPTKFTLVGCGFGSAIGGTSLFYVEKHNGKWLAYVVPKELVGESYFESLEKVKLMATNRLQNVNAKKIDEN